MSAEPAFATAEGPLPTYAHPLPGEIHWGPGLRAAVIAVLVSAVPLTLLVGAPIGLSMLIAGFVSVTIYRRKFPLPLTAPMGARLGAASGAIGFGFLAIGIAATERSLHGWAHIQEWILNRIQQSAAGSPADQVQMVTDFFKSPVGMVTAVAMLFVGFLIFSGVGGALGALILRRRSHM